VFAYPGDLGFAIDQFWLSEQFAAGRSATPVSRAVPSVSSTCLDIEGWPGPDAKQVVEGRSARGRRSLIWPSISRASSLGDRIDLHQRFREGLERKLRPGRGGWEKDRGAQTGPEGWKMRLPLPAPDHHRG